MRLGQYRPPLKTPQIRILNGNSPATNKHVVAVAT
jgi:hypothetical protein